MIMTTVRVSRMYMIGTDLQMARRRPMIIVNPEGNRNQAKSIKSKTIGRQIQLILLRRHPFDIGVRGDRYKVIV